MLYFHNKKFHSPVIFPTTIALVYISTFTLDKVQVFALLCRSYLGVAEAEIESLANEKEGCDDEIEYVTVQRPADYTHIMSDATHQQQQNGTASNNNGSSASVESGSSSTNGSGPTKDGMKWVNVPLGSARVSLGWMSTFEDVEAFAMFVESKYKDRST